jgi:type IV pilus assembly protein PilC
LILILLLVIFLRIISRTKPGKRAIDFLTLKIPIVSPLIQKTNSAYAVRTLSSLITSGVPIVRSLEIVSGAVENVYFQETLKEASEKVRKGEKLSEALWPYQKLYSPTVVQMIQVGEETGETSTVLAKLADFYEEEVANATKNLSAVIEPVLMLLIGAAVGFFAISMIQPIYGMLGAIK